MGELCLMGFTIIGEIVVTLYGWMFEIQILVWAPMGKILVLLLYFLLLVKQ